MRLLFLTNFYPPASRGGYDQWCQEVADGLQDLGHEIMVLTSQYCQTEITAPEAAWIRRQLHLEMEIASFRNSLGFFLDRKQREQENLARLRATVDDFQPEAIFIWGMWNLHRSLAQLAEDLLPGRVVYYMGDYWPTLPSQFEFYWRAPARNWITATPKKLLGLAAQRMLAGETLPKLQLQRVIFPTVFMRCELERKGIMPAQSEIIYGAIDTSLYAEQETPPATQGDCPFTLLYAGRLTHEKGVHTAIEALALVVRAQNKPDVRLSIVGAGDAAYERFLHDRVQQNNLEPYVNFLGVQPKSAMPMLYRQTDVLLFTSIWDEPFGRVMVEAMASGVAVIGTATGGAAEILQDHDNALIFPAGDARALADRILLMAQDSALRQRLCANARQTALEKFDMQRMTAQIDSFLQTIHKEVSR